MYKFGTIESAIRDSETMISLADKKLFISIYASLINEDLKRNLSTDNVDSVFKELCKHLREKKANL